MDYQEYQALDELMRFARDHAEEVYGDENEYPENQENAISLWKAINIAEHVIEQQGLYDNDTCPSAIRPLTEGETAHKWAEMPITDDEGTPVILCNECGANKT